uniref:Uncharacterized protein n=1 Tax=Geospiza parvula TaxID=87175 RepID=A0A8C3NJ16_GEOPR
AHFSGKLQSPLSIPPAQGQENIFSSTDLLKNNSENLSGLIFAAQAVRRPSGLSTKRRKARKVLYPAHVRKYLPRQKKDPVKRWLLFCAGAAGLSWAAFPADLVVTVIRDCGCHQLQQKAAELELPSWPGLGCADLPVTAA